PVAIPGRQGLAIRGQATDGSAVVTRGDEFAATGDEHRRRSAALLRSEDPVGLAVPDGNGVAIVLDVIELAVMPDGALRKVDVIVQDLEGSGVAGQRETGRHEAACYPAGVHRDPPPT